MKSYGEQLMCKYLDILLPYKYIDNYRPDWLQNTKTGKNLELDRYYPYLKVGFEYQGELHNLSGYKQKLDKLKLKLCRQNKITLIQIKPKDLRSSVIWQKYLYVCRKKRIKIIDNRNELKQLDLLANVYRKRLKKKYG